MKISVGIRSMVSATDSCLLIELIFFSADGFENRDLVNFTLPMEAWIWDVGWQSKPVYQGQHLGLEVSW
jgi:hypothetical protein